MYIHITFEVYVCVCLCAAPLAGSLCDGTVPVYVYTHVLRQMYIMNTQIYIYMYL